MSHTSTNNSPAFWFGRDEMTPSRLVAIADGGSTALASGLGPSFAAARAVVDDRIANGPPVYGVTTGFGASCVHGVPDPELANMLASNLHRYHGCGLGRFYSAREARAILAARIAQLAAGWSGLRLSTLDALNRLLTHDVVPCIPELGSVGASGDLTPLSYLVSVLVGEGQAFFRGERLPAAEALARAELSPWVIAPKESLSIMNGTSVMAALAAIGLVRAQRFCESHAAVTAWVSTVIRGRSDHFDERVFLAKPHPGSITYAREVRHFLQVPARPTNVGSGVQDPYSVRCAPHVVGVLRDALTDAERSLTVELNGAGDNPLICAETGEILHGGNFYGGHVGYICDALKGAVASAAEVCERQLVVLTHPSRSRGLPENLVTAPDAQRWAHHGFKAIEILASSLVAEALKMTMPAASFSRSTEGHNQDKVPMGAIAARELRSVLDLSETVLVLTLLACAQATDALGGPSNIPELLRIIYERIRVISPPMLLDRALDVEIAALVDAYRAGALGLEVPTFASAGVA